MSKTIAFPFLTLPDEVVFIDDWLIGDIGHPLNTVDFIYHDWDYDRDIEVACNLSVDLLAAAKALDLRVDDLQLDAILKVGTGRGTTPRSILHSKSLRIDKPEGEVQLSAQLDSPRLSSRLWMEASIVLAADPQQYGRLSPRQPGSRLWSSSTNILLEDGGDSRLPMDAVSFSQVFAGKEYEEALWYLDWRNNAWDSDFAGNVRLYLNRDKETFLQNVLAGDPFHLRAIMVDVMMQLISSYVSSEARDFPLEQDESSLAKQSQDWLALAFPGQSAAAVKTLMHDKPSDFHAAIQAAAEIEDEP